MITRYLTIKYIDPIKVEFKDGVDLLNAISDYIDCYGDCFIALMDSFEDGLTAQRHWYELYGDIDICQDLNTIHHLDKCYQLEYQEG